MPKFDIQDTKEPGPGFGCSCRAFRLGEPTPEQALKELARSANVTTEREFCHPWRDETPFTAWTEPDVKHKVWFDPQALSGTGHCKHVLGCLSHWVPWFRQVALGAAWALDRIAELEKENKRLGREVAKRDREIGKLRG